MRSTAPPPQPPAPVSRLQEAELISRMVAALQAGDEALALKLARQVAGLEEE
jgi:hypothetical protein